MDVDTEWPGLGYSAKTRCIVMEGGFVILDDLERDEAYRLIGDRQALKQEVQKRQLRISKAVSFTGHRPEPIGGYGPNQTKDEICAFLRQTIKKLSDEGFDEFISGAALGVDQWAADVVIEMGLRLTIALPFAGYGENWPQESRDYLEAQKAKASKIVIVCEGEYKPHKNHERNKWMLDNSSIVVVVWNGSAEGGTASACRGLKKSGKRYIRYNPISKQQEPI